MDRSPRAASAAAAANSSATAPYGTCIIPGAATLSSTLLFGDDGVISAVLTVVSPRASTALTGVDSTCPVAFPSPAFPADTPLMWGTPAGVNPIQSFGGGYIASSLFSSSRCIRLRYNKILDICGRSSGVVWKHLLIIFASVSCCAYPGVHCADPGLTLTSFSLTVPGTSVPVLEPFNEAEEADMSGGSGRRSP